MFPNCFQRLRSSTWDSLGTKLAHPRSIRQHAPTFSRRYSSSVPVSSPRSWSPVIIGSIASGLLGYSLSTFGTPLTSQAPEEAEPKYGTPKDFERAVYELRASFDSDDAVSTHPEDLRIHGFSAHDHNPGENFHFSEFFHVFPHADLAGAPHTVVVYPRSTEDVVKIVKIAVKYRMPITAYSGGTSIEGQFRGVSCCCICVLSPS